MWENCQKHIVVALWIVKHMSRFYLFCNRIECQFFYDRKLKLRLWTPSCIDLFSIWFIISVSLSQYYNFYTMFLPLKFIEFGILFTSHIKSICLFSTLMPPYPCWIKFKNGKWMIKANLCHYTSQQLKKIGWSRWSRDGLDHH